ncbi:MAG: metal-dependent hydrolase [Fimbriimonadaceae bacterium]|nr:metal-dependent hydrolase [Fimbriimonadaceae bacterium]
MRVTFLGHACFIVESAAGRVIFDPFLSGNDQASVGPDQVEVEAVLLTHGHGDHVGDAVSIARRTQAPVVAVYELATLLGWRGVDARAQHIGGACDYPFGRVKFTHATHGTGYVDEANQTITYCGGAAGILYTAAGRTVYHLGDTGLTADLELVGRRHRIDVALLPIGDHFTMGPDDAAEAVRLIRPRIAVPCHYDTFPAIRQDPAAFAAAVGDAAEVRLLAPGDSLEC